MTPTRRGLDRKISLASRVVPEATPEQCVEAAAAGGFDAAGIWVDPAKWNPAATAVVRQRAKDAGLDVLDVEVIRIMPGPFDSNHIKLIEIAAELGAANVLSISMDPDHVATLEKYRRLCEEAARHGLRMALEFGKFSKVGTIETALDIVAAADHPAAALLIDPLHLSRSGGQPRDIAKVPPQLLPYSQFCDATAKGPSPDDPDAILDEARHARLELGKGALPLSQVLQELPPGIPLSIEVCSRPLRDRYPDFNERARVLAASTRAFLTGP